jgi:hypothetical protein
VVPVGYFYIVLPGGSEVGLRFRPVKLRLLIIGGIIIFFLFDAVMVVLFIVNP